MPVKHSILKEELIDQHGVTFNFKQKKNMQIKAKKVYCSSIYVIDYFYSRVPPDGIPLKNDKVLRPSNVEITCHQSMSFPTFFQ